MYSFGTSFLSILTYYWLQPVQIIVLLWFRLFIYLDIIIFFRVFFFFILDNAHFSVTLFFYFMWFETHLGVAKPSNSITPSASRIFLSELLSSDFEWRSCRYSSTKPKKNSKGNSLFVINNVPAYGNTSTIILHGHRFKDDTQAHQLDF